MKIASKYDEYLIARLEHLQNHNCFLPHIGKEYDTAVPKILIIAESHYLPMKNDNTFSANEWYFNFKKVYSILDNESIDWINTRGVVGEYLKKKTKKGGLSIFHNLEKSFKNVYENINLFEVCAYINYFQRPSEVKGGSIKVDPIDSKIALENVLVLIEILKPNKIIFVSSKAYNDFKLNTTDDLRKQLPFIGWVPHPSASSWWNRSSSKYGLNSKGRIATGKEKFERIIKIREIQDDLEKIAVEVTLH